MTHSDGPLRLLCIVGARPNFMKIAPLMRVFRARADRFDARLVHTGQHYDEAMKDAFFRQLHIPEPDIDLGVWIGAAMPYRLPRSCAASSPFSMN